MRLNNKDKNNENSFDKKILKIVNGEYSLDNTKWKQLDIDIILNTID